MCAKLTAAIAQKGDAWQAVFEGDCGRPYKYTITMEGRQAGGAVLFKGTADLGPKDGGVYDWIGRADDKEFVGFFTSGFSTGVFTMTKANEACPLSVGFWFLLVLWSFVLGPPRTSDLGQRQDGPEPRTKDQGPNRAEG